MGNTYKQLDQFHSNQEVSLFYKISTILTSTLNLNETVSEIFSILSEKLGDFKAVVLVQTTYGDTEYSHMSFGFSPTEEELVALRRLTEEALSIEKTLFIPKLSEDDFYLRDNEQNEISDESFICVPIILGDDKFGAISIDCPYKNDRYLKKNMKVFSVLALMIGQELRISRLLNLEKDALRKENVKLRDELREKYNIHNMIGKSHQMFQVYETIKQVASSNATVLVRGESGTGKELVAHAVHYNSSRSDGPFIKINCGAIPEALMESELFGHEKGAFTDASVQKIGKLEAAKGGTVFFDEVAELPLLLQVKLLRAIQEKEITRIGGLKPIPLNIRIIAATNRNLEDMIEDNTFRKDLYYRLNVFPIFLPALKKRRSDIVLLAEHFLERFSEENNKTITAIARPVVDRLCSYHWPGNVRELMNCIERAVILCNGDVLDVDHLPPSLQDLEVIPYDEPDASFKEKVENYEKSLLNDALKRAKGNHTKVAKLLKSTPRIVTYKIKTYGLED